MPVPVNFTWDVNPVALLALLGGAVTVIAFWIRASDVAASAKRLAEVTEKEAREARKVADEACRVAKIAQEEAAKSHERISTLQAAIAAYREVQAERLVSREVLREVEDRLAGSIDRLGDRLDSLVKELVTGRHNPH